MKQGLAMVLLSICGVAQGDVEASSCPPGTDARVGSSASGRHQICVDPKTGLQEGPAFEWHANGKVAVEGHYRRGKMQGPYRMFNDDGEMLFETQFDQGIPKSGHLTSVGLKFIIGPLASDASTRFMLIEVSAPDDSTIRYDVKLPPEAIPPEYKELDSPANREMACDVFHMPFDNVTVQLRYLERDGKVSREARFTRKDCPEPR